MWIFLIFPLYCWVYWKKLLGVRQKIPFANCLLKQDLNVDIAAIQALNLTSFFVGKDVLYRFLR